MGKLRANAPEPPAELLRLWRARGQITDERLGWALERAAEQWPNRLGLVDDSGRYTFGELRKRANAISRALLEAGVQPGDVVTWSLPNSVDAVATAAATWRIGAVSNPVVHIYREHEFGFILRQLEPTAVITVDEFRGRRYTEELDGVFSSIGLEPKAKLVRGNARGWKAIADLAPANSLPKDVEPAPPDEVCLVLYTSGTTADPKGAMHTSATLSQEVRSMQREWALTRRDVMFMPSPLTHITGVLLGLIVPSTVGARSVLVDQWNPPHSVEIIERERATYMAGATVFLQGILEEYRRRGLGRSSLKQFTCGGAAVPPHLIEEIEELGIIAHRAWGMTEFPTTTIAGENDPLERRAYTDGRIAEAVECETVDLERNPLPCGREGELRVRGPERMVGYVDARRTEEVVDREGWFYTGDVGVVDEAGYVTITGRIKDIINRGGEKFSAQEIENLLAAHPSVAEVAVIGVPGGRLGERVCAAIVPREEDSFDPGALKSFLLDRRIAKQKIPEEFRAVGELPRTASGKIQKFKLIEEWQKPLPPLGAARS